MQKSLSLNLNLQNEFLLQAAGKMQSMNFSSLPGIGQKTALRLVLHLLNQPQSEVEKFSNSLLILKGISGIALNVIIFLIRRSVRYAVQ
jgi:Holliday junction resolvasome RuvABC DNA-binding subunit